MQVRFWEAKSERTVWVLRGMLKLAWAAVRRRGIPVPRVAFLKVERPVSVASVLVQAMSAGAVHFEPVKPLAQTQRQLLLTNTVVPPLEHGFELLHAEMSAELPSFFFGRTMRVTGITTAAAMRRIRIMQSRIKAQVGMPQHFRERCLPVYEVGELGPAVCVLDRPDFGRGDGHREPLLSAAGEANEGDGKRASMSDIEPDRELRPCLSFSFSSSMPKKPSALEVLPRSRFEANFVALLINSGRLLELPLDCSLSLTASRLSLAGLLVPRSLIDGGTEPKGVAEPFDPIAPPFSNPPRTAFTRGSSGVVGVLAPDVGTLVLLDVGALGLKGAGYAEASSN